MISRRTLLAALAALPAFRRSASGADFPPEDLAALLAEGTVAVVALDLTRPKLPELIGRLVASPVGRYLPERFERVATNRLRDLLTARVNRLYLLFDLAEMPGPPVLAVALQPDADGRGQLSALLALASALRFGGNSGWSIRGFVAVGRTDAVNRLRSTTPAERPDLRAALAEGGPDGAIRVAISPGRALRRAVDEAMPRLPAELGVGPMATLTQGIAWGSLVLAGDLRRARITVQADGPVRADDCRRLAALGIESAARAFTGLPQAKGLALRLEQVRPTLDGNRVVADLDPETVLALVAVPFGQAREAIERTEAMNQLKTFGLALHNYHFQFGSFPPAYRADPAGKPLLSWRVLILPYLDQDDLFKQFKLDEPWDGPSNKPLIARMPPIFAAPSAPPELAGEGKTVYLTARGPDTAFPGVAGVKIDEITDGTDSTVLVLAAGPGEAVPWTKPDDWDAAAVPPALAGREWAAVLGDGSARRFPPGVPPAAIRALLTRKGGEAIDWTKL